MTKGERTGLIAVGVTVLVGAVAIVWALDVRQGERDRRIAEENARRENTDRRDGHPASEPDQRETDEYKTPAEIRAGAAEVLTGSFSRATSAVYRGARASVRGPANTTLLIDKEDCSSETLGDIARAAGGEGGRLREMGFVYLACAHSTIRLAL